MTPPSARLTAHNAGVLAYLRRQRKVPPTGWPRGCVAAYRRGWGEARKAMT